MRGEARWLGRAAEPPSTAAAAPVRFAVPIGLAAAALAGPLVLWYVLRSRRPRVEVASTYLWRRTDRAVAAAMPWQRFRPDRTFWLVLVALLLGAAALARPAVPVEAVVGEHTILVLDISGSMLADEDGPTRLELARREALRLVERVAPGGLLSVVEAGSRARVLLSASPDAVSASRALRSLQAVHGPADLADAFTLAASLQQSGQQTVTHLYTDGVVPAEAARLAPPGLIVDAVGQDRANLAVSRLEAVPAGAGAATAFVQVRNLGLLEQQARLVLEVLEGEAAAPAAAPVAVPIAVRHLRLAPRGVADLVLPVDHRPVNGGVLHASVAPVGADVTGAPARDALAIDDAAWAVLSGPREVRALVAGPGNVFLTAALAAIPGVQVSTAPQVPENLDEVDLLVVDRVAAPAEPLVPTIYVAPSAPPRGVTVSGALERPVLTFQDPGHALLADVDLSEVALAGAQAVTAPALQPVAASPSGPLLLAGRLGPQPVVYLGFDLLRSNLPLQVAWPVLTANAVAWLTGPPATAPSTAGAQPVLTVPPGVAGVQATPPGGAPIALDPAWPQISADHVGVWTLSYRPAAEAAPPPPSPLPLAVNADPGESDLSRARPGPVDPSAAPATESAAAAPATGLRVYGRELLAGVLALLLVEWALSHGLRPLKWLKARRGRRLRRALRTRRGPRRIAA